MLSSRNRTRLTVNETAGLSSISKQTEQLKTNIAQTSSAIQNIVDELVGYRSEERRSASNSHLHPIPRL